MSELSQVINLTEFYGVFHRPRKAVDNPAAVRASHYLRREDGAGRALITLFPNPPQDRYPSNLVSSVFFGITSIGK